MAHWRTRDLPYKTKPNKIFISFLSSRP